MEVEVDKLELMFQNADSDLNYIQYRLEYEIKTNHPDSAGEKNPVTLLKELSVIKSRYQALYVLFKPVPVEQKETKSRSCSMTMIQELQK
uniref:Protein FAM33A n=1 Tax=Jaculus jaculus TaxID=51337 RepID=A0A8C5LHS0_JACJA